MHVTGRMVKRPALASVTKFWSRLLWSPPRAREPIWAHEVTHAPVLSLTRLTKPGARRTSNAATSSRPPISPRQTLDTKSMPSFFAQSSAIRARALTLGQAAPGGQPALATSAAHTTFNSDAGGIHVCGSELSRHYRRSE